YLAKTDKNGKYNLSVLVTKVGVNNLSVGYSGNAKYNPYEVNSTFNVGKQNVIVTYDPVKEVPAGTNVTITGKFTDNLGKAIVNSNVKIFVNGVKYYAKTDSTGKYSLSVLVTKVGVNNLSVGYSGNAKYNPYEVNSTFNVGKQNVIVTYDPVMEVPAGTNVTITGKFTDNLGKAIVKSNVKIFVNGVKYYAKTDSTGKYSLSVLVTKVGTNNLSVGYSGNAKYNAYEVNSTFTVGKQNVIVTYNKISDVKKGNNVTITGKFTDNLGKAVTNSNVKITINGVKYYAKTDSTGKYTLSVATTKEGVNNVTIGYSGSAKYNAFETSTTFTVLKAQ
uniref:Ig-like domain-containing protein n=1 Tax=Methanosphaera sp. TaxID=2666342 RepID=UPI0025E09759